MVTSVPLLPSSSSLLTGLPPSVPTCPVQLRTCRGSRPAAGSQAWLSVRSTWGAVGRTGPGLLPKSIKSASLGGFRAPVLFSKLPDDSALCGQGPRLLPGLRAPRSLSCWGRQPSDGSAPCCVAGHVYDLSGSPSALCEYFLLSLFPDVRMALPCSHTKDTIRSLSPAPSRASGAPGGHFPSLQVPAALPAPLLS